MRQPEGKASKLRDQHTLPVRTSSSARPSATVHVLVRRARPLLRFSFDRGDRRNRQPCSLVAESSEGRSSSAVNQAREASGTCSPYIPLVGISRSRYVSASGSDQTLKGLRFSASAGVHVEHAGLPRDQGGRKTWGHILTNHYLEPASCARGERALGCLMNTRKATGK